MAIKVSAEFVAQLKEDLNELLKTRDIAVEEIVEAKKNGDLSENADYDAARDLQSRTEEKIAEIEAILNNCELYVPKTYTYDADYGETATVVVVSEDEAVHYHLSEGEPLRISFDSPVGIALNGSKVGQEIEVLNDEDEVLFNLTVKEIK